MFVYLNFVLHKAQPDLAMEFRTFAETQLAEEIRRLSTGGAIISVPDTAVPLGKPYHAIPSLLPTVLHMRMTRMRLYSVTAERLMSLHHIYV